MKRGDSYKCIRDLRGHYKIGEEATIIDMLGNGDICLSVGCWLDPYLLNKYWERIEVEEKYEVEFEDDLNCILKVSDLIKKYLKWNSKVKIKAREGKIVIERIK